MKIIRVHHVFIRIVIRDRQIQANILTVHCTLFDCTQKCLPSLLYVSFMCPLTCLLCFFDNLLHNFLVIDVVVVVGVLVCSTP